MANSKVSRLKYKNPDSNTVSVYDIDALTLNGYSSQQIIDMAEGRTSAFSVNTSEQVNTDGTKVNQVFGFSPSGNFVYDTTDDLHSYTFSAETLVNFTAPKRYGFAYGNIGNVAFGEVVSNYEQSQSARGSLLGIVLMADGTSADDLARNCAKCLLGMDATISVSTSIDQECYFTDISGNKIYLASHSDEKNSHLHIGDVIRTLNYYNTESKAIRIISDLWVGGIYNDTGEVTNESGASTALIALFPIDSTVNMSAYSRKNHTHAYDKTTSVSRPTFQGAETKVSVSGTPSGTITSNLDVGLNVTKYTDFGEITSVGSLPSAKLNETNSGGGTGKASHASTSYDSSDQSLTFSSENAASYKYTLTFNAGTLPGRSVTKQPVSGVTVNPTYSSTFKGDALNSTGTLTPNGNVVGGMVIGYTSTQTGQDDSD